MHFQISMVFNNSKSCILSKPLLKHSSRHRHCHRAPCFMLFKIGGYYRYHLDFHFDCISLVLFWNSFFKSILTFGVTKWPSEAHSNWLVGCEIVLTLHNAISNRLRQKHLNSQMCVLSLSALSPSCSIFLFIFGVSGVSILLGSLACVNTGFERRI